MISPGPEDYEELKEQIERAYKLDPKRKELIRDRISELEFQRQKTTFLFSLLLPAIIALEAILISATYALITSDKNSYAPEIIMLLICMIIILFGYFYYEAKLEKSDKEVREKIRKNYDILLGRKP